MRAVRCRAGDDGAAAVDGQCGRGAAGEEPEGGKGCYSEQRERGATRQGDAPFGGPATSTPEARRLIVTSSPAARAPPGRSPRRSPPTGTAQPTRGPSHPWRRGARG